MKRLLDILLSAFALVALSPLMVVVALAVYVTSEGPVFFKQRRVGRHGSTFDILKFRSMVVDAEERGGFSTADGDPRITPIGSFIRRTSIDELPQLINVLKGDMSIVGPRPDVPAQRDLYSPANYQLRHSVKPGITGLAQATLRSAATHEQRTEMDLCYARQASLALDIKIIVLTFKQVVSKGGN